MIKEKAAPFEAPFSRDDANPGDALIQSGFVVLQTSGVVKALACGEDALLALNPSWADLPPDLYLKDGGRYRRRRHSCFIVDGETVTLVPHRAHWQPIEYNALHGGMQRWFEPMPESVVASPVWSSLMVWLAAIANTVSGVQPWFVEAHQFRIDTTDGIGRPTLPYFWLPAMASRAEKRGSLMQVDHRANASRCRSPGHCCCWMMRG
jgi:hypothetical protein